jgi:hypothetical protein
MFENATLGSPFLYLPRSFFCTAIFRRAFLGRFFEVVNGLLTDFAFGGFCVLPSPFGNLILPDDFGL